MQAECKDHKHIQIDSLIRSICQRQRSSGAAVNTVEALLLQRGLIGFQQKLSGDQGLGGLTVVLMKYTQHCILPPEL